MDGWWRADGMIISTQINQSAKHYISSDASFQAIVWIQAIRGWWQHFQAIDYLWPNLHQFSFIQKNGQNTFKFMNSKHGAPSHCKLLPYFMSAFRSKVVNLKLALMHFPENFVNPKFGVAHLFRRFGRQPLASLQIHIHTHTHDHLHHFHHFQNHFILIVCDNLKV